METDVGEQDHDTLAWEQEGLVIDLTETPPPVLVAGTRTTANTPSEKKIAHSTSPASVLIFSDRPGALQP